MDSMTAMQIWGVGITASALIVVVQFCDFWRSIPGCYNTWFRLRRWTGHAAYDGSPETYDLVFRNAASVELVKDPEMARHVRDYKQSYRHLRDQGNDICAAREKAIRRLRAVLPQHRHEDWPYARLAGGTR